MKKIVVTLNTNELLPDQLKRLKELGEVTYYTTKPKTTDEWLARCQGADVICTGRFGLLDRVKELHDVFISLPFVSTEWIDSVEMNKRNINIANSPGCNSAAVAEWVIGMMINLLRQLPVKINASAPPPNSNSIGLFGKHVLVLGDGHVGTRVIKVCQALDMKVKVFKRGDDLIESVKDVDVIIDCVGANKTSFGLLSKAFFNSVKFGAYFITVTSPVIWDVDGMLGSLDSGRLAGVATDVANVQMEDVSDPLFRKLAGHPKILATPHIAYRSDVTTRIANDMMIDNVEAWLKGKPINLV